MHVVLVSREYVPTLRGGGIASYVKEMANSFVEVGHQVTVICASDDTRKESAEIIDGIRVIRLSGGDFIIPSVEGKSTFKKFRLLYRFHSYRKKIKKAILSLENVDIVEVPEFGAEGYYLYKIPCPIVIRLHTPSLLNRKTLKKVKFRLLEFYSYWCALQEVKVLKKASYITSCSKELRDWTVQYFAINKELITVIYNPVNTAQWDINTVNMPPKNKEEVNIFFAGTVVETKGIRELIEACNILKQRKYNIQLTIAGKLNNYSHQLQQELTQRGIDWCYFLGNVERNRLKKLYQECDLACFPSWWENLPLVCIEAMACGCIVVGSSCGGMSEVIEDGKDGFLVEPKNSELLAQTIEKAIDMSEQEKVRMSALAKEKIISKFSTEVIVKEMVEYYQNVITNYQSKL